MNLPNVLPPTLVLKYTYLVVMQLYSALAIEQQDRLRPHHSNVC